MQPTSTLTPAPAGDVLPDHTQLPDRDGAIVNNFQEHPQSILLTGSLVPRLQELHPDGQFCIGQDSGIYWRITQPPLNGCKAPDWFYVPGVPPMLNGQMRRSYVLWQEIIRPLVVIEYASSDGSEERDATPWTGKFWVYEQAISASYYAIFEAARGSVELYRLSEGRYQRVPAGRSGRLPIQALGVELGIWHGTYLGMEMPWLRAWDAATGLMLPGSEERAEAERTRAEAACKRADTAESLLDDARRRLEEECERAEKERRRVANLAERLRSLGIDPDAPITPEGKS